MFVAMWSGANNTVDSCNFTINKAQNLHMKIQWMKNVYIISAIM